MSNIQEIDVYIQQDGTVRIEVRGVKGKSCLNLTENIEKALGGQVINREHTDEYYQQEETQSDSTRLTQE